MCPQDDFLPCHIDPGFCLEVRTEVHLADVLRPGCRPSHASQEASQPGLKIPWRTARTFQVTQQRKTTRRGVVKVKSQHQS